jgi:hypothetical protein
MSQEEQAALAELDGVQGHTQVEAARAALLGVIAGHIKAEIDGPLWRRCIDIITARSRD